MPPLAKSRKPMSGASAHAPTHLVSRLPPLLCPPRRPQHKKPRHAQSGAPIPGPPVLVRRAAYGCCSVRLEISPTSRPPWSRCAAGWGTPLRPARLSPSAAVPPLPFAPPSASPPCAVWRARSLPSCPPQRKHSQRFSALLVRMKNGKTQNSHAKCLTMPLQFDIIPLVGRVRRARLALSRMV